MGAEEYSALLRVLSYQRIPFTILSKDLRPEVTSNDNSSANNPQLADRSDAGTSVRDLLPAGNPSPIPVLSQTNSAIGTNMVEGLTEPQFDSWPNPDGSTFGALPQTLWNSDQSEDSNATFQPFSCLEEEVVPFSYTYMSIPDQAHESSSTSIQHEEGHNNCDNMEALIEQLSERIGSLQIGPGGHIRYYGPTSNFNLVKMPIPNAISLHRTVRHDGQDYLNRLGLGKEVPPALEDHLVSLYFAWQDPALHIVDRNMFEDARTSWKQMNDTPYYSEALHNSM